MTEQRAAPSERVGLWDLRLWSGLFGRKGPSYGPPGGLSLQVALGEGDPAPVRSRVDDG